MGVCASLFFDGSSDSETLNNRVKPSDDQVAYLREQKEALENWLVDELDDLGYEVSTFLQGSYRFHTLIKPLLRGAEYDVDLGFYFVGGRAAEVDSAFLRDSVQRALLRYEGECEEVRNVEEPKERCSRVSYNKKFHIDVPTYHETAGGVVRLATLRQGWERSDPSAMLEWFQRTLDPDSAARAMTRRLVRYMKAWAALSFAGEDEVPSSLMLTVLTVDAVGEVVDEGDDDDDALAKVVVHIYERMRDDSFIPNPVAGDSDDDLNRLSASAQLKLVGALGAFADSAEKAIACEDEAAGAIAWAEAFSYVFPLPEGLDAVQSDAAGGVVAASPAVTAHIFDSRGGRQLRSHEGYVPHARVGEEIKFVITNPEVIPPGGKIKWVVRNTGSEAHSISDLGHVLADNGSLTQWESASYMGQHYMDCEIWSNGTLRSLCRVPVHITRAAMPPRHPAKRPGYTRIIRRGR